MDEKQRRVAAQLNGLCERGAAKLLGTNPEKLHYRMQKYGLR